MATRVTVNQPGSISVRVGGQNPASVQAITYGTRTLKSAADLLYAGANTGDVVTYNAETKNFVVDNISNSITDIDGGIF